jgi:L-2,4-diaminobutyrate decarboxylase
LDPSFAVDLPGLRRAIDLLAAPGVGAASFPDRLPERGLGEGQTLEQMAPVVIGGARRLEAATTFAHMDPPAPWVTWALTLWNASLNQNLLHPDTAPAAQEIEARVVRWLAPFFGADGGHMTPGSTVANLTALWVAREVAGVRTVVASEAAHLSIEKAAHLLGLAFRQVPTDTLGRMNPAEVGDLDDACLVLTAGTTAIGAIDPLSLCGEAAWTHVDAAWAGPLRLSRTHAARLAGIEAADSVAVSAHKWLFQPKESALVLFRDTARAHPAISSGGAYLAQPNVGLLGSHGANAVPLLGLLLAWGREGLEDRIDRCMAAARRFAGLVSADAAFELYAPCQTGVVLWRARDVASDVMKSRMDPGMVSLTRMGSQVWLRCVAANPNADPDRVYEAARKALANQP